MASRPDQCFEHLPLVRTEPQETGISCSMASRPNHMFGHLSLVATELLWPDRPELPNAHPLLLPPSDKSLLSSPHPVCRTAVTA